MDNAITICPSKEAIDFDRFYGAFARWLARRAKDVDDSKDADGVKDD